MRTPGPIPADPLPDAPVNPLPYGGSGDVSKPLATVASTIARRVKLGELETVLADLDYPVSREAAVDAFDDVILVLAEGEQHLGDLLAESGDDTFESMGDLEEEVLNLLPRNAVGEPYQTGAEGDRNLIATSSVRCPLGQRHEARTASASGRRPIRLGRRSDPGAAALLASFPRSRGSGGFSRWR